MLILSLKKVVMCDIKMARAFSSFAFNGCYVIFIATFVCFVSLCELIGNFYVALQSMYTGRNF